MFDWDQMHNMGRFDSDAKLYGFICAVISSEKCLLCFEPCNRADKGCKRCAIHGAFHFFYEFIPELTNSIYWCKKLCRLVS